MKHSSYAIAIVMNFGICYFLFVALGGRIVRKLSVILLVLISIFSFTYWSNKNTFAIEDSQKIGERLDGDYAYISEAGLVADGNTKSGYAMKTGTGPFDETNDPGEDQGEENNIIRTYDVITYTTYFKTKMYDSSPKISYRTGLLYYEFVLPYSQDEACFDLESMGWLKAKSESKYTNEVVDINGLPYQILKGSFLLEPNESSLVAIGESYQELNVAIRILSMKNGQKINSYFTYWLDGNDVDQDATVFNCDHVCQEHGVLEYKTITPPEVIVSAIPRFNIQLKNSEERTQYLDFFDFSTGNDLALNKGDETLYGRVNVIGITIQMMGKDLQHGIKGCELPSGDTLSFDLVLDSKYLSNSGGEIDITKSYAPKVWSLDENKKNSLQVDERTINSKLNFASGGAPFNNGNDYYSCYNGGQWSGIQASNRVHIEVSHYQLKLDSTPYTDANVNSGDYKYYNPITQTNYWDRSTLCFSAGEVWIVQPFYNQDNQYIVDEFDTGSFLLTIQDENLNITSKSNQLCTNQIKTTDDTLTLTNYLEKDGTIDQSIIYQQYDKIDTKTSLTEGCYENGKDWILSNGQLCIQELLKHNSAEGLNVGVAYDDLMKFDDAFFVLEDARMGSTAGFENMEYTFLYGAKVDKQGWDHQGLNPDQAGYDLEMMQSTADDLIFFSSLDELTAQGYTCVGVLLEARGIASGQSTNCYVGLMGHVKENAQVNQVYMVTHSAVAWSKRDVLNSLENQGITSLTDQQYKEYMEKFPTRKDCKETLSYETDYISAFWNNNYDTNSALKNYTKSVYDQNGFVTGTSGVSYGDSCLLLDFASKVKKSVAQNNQDDTPKLVYDLDTNQRTVDYVLTPCITRSLGENKTSVNKKTTLTIVDTLPKGLSYIPYSSYYGGTYQQVQVGSQGKIIDGMALEPQISKQEDGSTILIWTLKDVIISEDSITYTPAIYYSCDIGKVGDEVNDVQNNDTLNNQVIIYSSDEQKKDFTLINENYANLSIQVSKNNAISLVKLADQSFIDLAKGNDLGATLIIANNVSNTMNLLAMDSLPYSGDKKGSSFTGDCFVSELSIQDKSLMKDLKLYYTNDAKQLGKTSIDYNLGSIDSNIWNELYLKEDGSFELPNDFKPVAIMMAGKLSGNTTLKIHITMTLPNALPGEFVVNRLTRDDLESDARYYIVKRRLEGIVWNDKDRDGLRQDEEEKIDQVKVTLLKLKEGGDPNDLGDYEPYYINNQEVTIETGSQYDLNTQTIQTYENGRYCFDNLPEGIYGVKFSDGEFSLKNYVASTINYGEDDTIDSDGEPYYENEKLLYASILNIDMPNKEKMATPIYESKYHDLGIYDVSNPETLVNDYGKPILIGVSILFMVALVVIKKYEH